MWSGRSIVDTKTLSRCFAERHGALGMSIFCMQAVRQRLMMSSPIFRSHLSAVKNDRKYDVQEPGQQFRD